MVSVVANCIACQELIIQALSCCWKWLYPGQELSGGSGTEEVLTGEPGGNLLSKSGGKSGAGTMKASKHEKAYGKTSPFPSSPQAATSVALLRGAMESNSSLKPRLLAELRCPGRKVWRTSSRLSATDLPGHRKMCDGQGWEEFTSLLSFSFCFFSFYIRTHAEKYLIALIALLLLACTHLAKQVKLICARFLRAQGPSMQNGSFVWQGPASSGSHPSLKFVRKFNLSKAPFSTLRQARGHLNQNQMYLSGLKITNSGLRSCQQRTTRARATKLACLMKF